MFKVPFIALVMALFFLQNTSLMASVDQSQKQLDKSFAIEHKTQRLGQESQKKVDQLAEQSRILLSRYQDLLQKNEYQKAYNAELRVLEQEQKADIATLKKQISDIKITQQKLLPLLRDMTNTLEQFIQLDIPFQTEQRLASIAELKNVLSRSQLPIADKFRRVMELFQSENDMNYDIALDRATIQFNDESLSVDLLRIGRSSLYWQTLDQQRSAIWDAASKQWILLDSQMHLKIRQAMRVANKESAPSLLPLPVILTNKQTGQEVL